MRVWDIHPGYLNRQSLLGEHRELHGIVSILVNNKKGYANHPETIRWVGFGWALKKRHQLIAAEMLLRGYQDKTPVLMRANKDAWPGIYIDEPGTQFKILKEKYQNKTPGRIPLPENAQQLWSQHKYSIMARDVNLYKQLGKDVATMKPKEDFSNLANILIAQLRIQPSKGGLRNALQHMWGYVSHQQSEQKNEVEAWSLNKLLTEIQRRSQQSEERYLISSTALSELAVWL